MKQLNSKKSHVSTQSSSMSLGIWIFLAVCLVVWGLSTRLLFSAEDSAFSSHEIHKIQALYDETSKLMRELVRCNSTQSQEIALKEMESEKTYYENEIKSLTREKISFEEKLFECVKEKHHYIEEYDHCTASVAEAKATIEESEKEQREIMKAVDELMKSHNINTDINFKHQVEKTPSPTNTNTVVAVNNAQTAPDNSNTKKWLVIGIPTVNRPGELDYLLRALQTMANELPKDSEDLMYGQIIVNVVHVVPGASHPRFDEARELYRDNIHFRFETLTTDEVYVDPKTGATPQNDIGTANIPGYRVRKQTRNLAAVMRRSYNLARYYMFLEDDMEFCNFGVQSFQYLLNKASNYHPNWLAIRASYGMNGIFMHSVDIPVFANYLLQHQSRRPPDHLVVEWFAGETAESKAYKNGRANIGFRHNLFRHIGSVSSLRSQHQGDFPACYELLVEPTVFKVEAFDLRECPQDDIWPCRPSRPGAIREHRMHWEHIYTK